MKRLRIRFSLRFILVLILLAALLCVPETRRALKQRELALAVARLGGTCTSEPRPGVPEFLRPYLSRDYGSDITSIQLSGHVAPVYTYSRAPAILRTQVIELFQMPAMKGVRDLVLFGTAFDTTVLQELVQWPEIRQIQLEETAVNKDSLGNMPFQFAGKVSAASWAYNGDRFVRSLHHSEMRITDDLQLFTRAHLADLAAARTLIDLAAQHAEVNTMEPVLNAVALAPGKQVDEVVREKTAHPNERVRLLAVLIAAARRDISGLRLRFQDTEQPVRFAAIDGMRRCTSEQLLESPGLLKQLQERYDNETDQRIRWSIIDQSVTFEDRSTQLLLGALDDQSSFVRACAARSLGTVGNSNSISYLERCLQDTDKFVRRHAANSIQAISERR